MGPSWEEIVPIGEGVASRVHFMPPVLPRAGNNAGPARVERRSRRLRHPRHKVFVIHGRGIEPISSRPRSNERRKYRMNQYMRWGAAGIALVTVVGIGAGV